MGGYKPARTKTSPPHRPPTAGPEITAKNAAPEHVGQFLINKVQTIGKIWPVQHLPNLGVAIFPAEKPLEAAGHRNPGVLSSQAIPSEVTTKKCGPVTFWSFFDQTVTKKCQDLARPACPKFGGCGFSGGKTAGGSRTQEPKVFSPPTSMSVKTGDCQKQGFGPD